MTLNPASKSPSLLEKLPTGHGHAGSALTEPVQLHPALEEVRKMREFQPPEPDLLKRWLEQPFFKDWFHRLDQAFNQMSEALARFFQRMHLPGAAHLPENIRDLFSGFVTFMAVLAGLFTLYVLLGIFLRWTQEKSVTAKPAPRFFEERLLISATHHQKQARLCASQGHYAEGIRQWYLATLCFLDESGLAPFAAARSNQEYRTMLGSSEVRGYFERLSRQFERIHYGNDAGNAEHCRQCESWYDRLSHEAQAGA